ncbi:MAG: DUF3368 domain-containing protein [Hungatella sp.]|uniref:DUF3368 domain-containing protein n=1 Tax=Hungatella sp. TaxID=2613924 RepID=UPI003991DFF4
MKRLFFLSLPASSWCVTSFREGARSLCLYCRLPLGILLKAKKAGIIPVIAPVLEEIKKNGFYISGTVERIVLDEAGES